MTIVATGVIFHHFQTPIGWKSSGRSILASILAGKVIQYLSAKKASVQLAGGHLSRASFNNIFTLSFTDWFSK